MAGWSGGSASVTGGPTTFNVSWTAPTYTFPSGSTNRSVTSSGGATSISCGTSTTRTWTATWYQPFAGGQGFWDTDTTSITASAPSCPPPNYLNLSASLASNNGTSPGPYPGVAYSFSAYNVGSYPVTVSWSIPGLGVSGSETLAVGASNTWFSNGFISAGYSTTYTGIISGSSNGGAESASSSVTTPAAPTYPPSWSDNVLADTFRVGEAYSDGVTAAGTAPMTYSVTAGTLPAGISLNSSTGAVTGTPTADGSYGFTIQASNGYGTPVTASFSGTVGKPKGEINYYDGSQWVQTPVSYRASSSWETGTVYVYNGTWNKSN